MDNHEISRQVANGYLAATESWHGCDWTTSFGPRGLDLRGMKAKQTRLLVQATSGEESEAWEAATRWLEQVERDANDARSAASFAVELFAQQRWEAALARITAACDLESRYHGQQLVWGPLRDLIGVRAAQANGEATLS